MKTIISIGLAAVLCLSASSCDFLKDKAQSFNHGAGDNTEATSEKPDKDADEAVSQAAGLLDNVGDIAQGAAAVAAAAQSASEHAHDNSSSSYDTYESMPSNPTYSGTINGKYGVVMELEIDGSYVSGYYYYTKYGPGNRMSVSGYLDDDSGRLEMDEFNPDGERTGDFSGLITPYSYSGTFHNYQGKTMTFSLSRK